ncbi:NAD(P)H-hydrate epimerase [Corynebacterium argentoratense]|uniref:NAD(P)H-hydrate epimerase n=1 Tax=Corynebacterium argentoratense TaxID=42817 RepID=UPI001F35A640|nr:NAD(P)H-hydrate epimerase [Corynebacterium argentoratense]MCF1765967.1 NAD(P)H-hydrate epimerase [Corynebacterium argentoratense]
MPAQHARAGMTSGGCAETTTGGLCGTPVYTPQQVRRAEQPLLAAQGLALMQSAAFAVAVEAADMLRSGSTTLGVYGSRVLVLVGAGNNGGDALFAAAELARRGAQVRVVASSDSVHIQGAEVARRAGVRWLDSPSAVGAFCPDLIIDGLLGIGAEGPLRGSVREVIDDVAGCAAAGTPVLAVDLPSGADPMGGAVDSATLVAQRTVTFGGVKPVHVLRRSVCGRVVCRGLGIDEQLRRELPWGLSVDGGCWPVPGEESNKYTGGVVSVYAGSSAYPGAAVLAVAGAVRATSSMVRYVGQCAQQVLSAFPSVVVGAGRSDCVVVGPGNATAVGDLLDVLQRDVSVVVDADALTAIASGGHRVREVLRERYRAGLLTVLTPHDGEFERLMGSSPSHYASRVDAARCLAKELGACVLLKGHTTVVVSPDDNQPVLIVPSRSSWAATPGSGDVLSGVLAAVVAAQPRVESVAVAAYAHALAAASFDAPCDARQLADAISPAVAEIVARWRRGGS